MAVVETSKIYQIYDYVRTEVDANERADGAFVFGRFDPLVAQAAAGKMNLVNYALIVGGIGKDSGALTRLQIPEAHYLASLMLSTYRADGNKIHVDPRPANGGECWEMGIETIARNNLPHDTLKVIIHPTSLRRIMAQGQAIASRPNVNFSTTLQCVGTNYRFNPENPVDQKEAVAELLRLADWPSKGWTVAQQDLPADLVEVARVYDAAWKTAQ